MAVKILCKSRLIRSCVKLVVSSQNRPFWSACIRENWHVLWNASFCTCKWACSNLMRCYNRWVPGYLPLTNILRPPLSAMPLRILLVKKDLESLDGFNLLRNLHLSLWHKLRTFWRSCRKVLLDFSLTVKAATLIFISGRGSVISSTK